jgi:hypothetical protein
MQHCGPLGEINSQKAEKILVLICRMATKPVLDEDPCAVVEVSETIQRGYLPQKLGSSDHIVPCGDPRALTGEAQCLPSVTSQQFGRI